jgi:uncharacterized membrane protein
MNNNQKNTKENLDQFYKLGIFYFNKDDKAIFKKRRSGLGLSPNYARFEAWLIIIALVAAIVYFGVL